jgi:hypothetical protein
MALQRALAVAWDEAAQAAVVRNEYQFNNSRGKFVRIKADKVAEFLRM